MKHSVIWNGSIGLMHVLNISSTLSLLSIYTRVYCEGQDPSPLSVSRWSNTDNSSNYDKLGAQAPEEAHG